MRQRSAQPPAAELHHIDMRTVNGLMKSFETVQLARINQKELPHGCTLLLKGDNSGAISLKIPPQREVGATISLRVLRQTLSKSGRQNCLQCAAVSSLFEIGR
jgi:hypothetical protein